MSRLRERFTLEQVLTTPMRVSVASRKDYHFEGVGIVIEAPFISPILMEQHYSRPISWHSSTSTGQHYAWLKSDLLEQHLPAVLCQEWNMLESQLILSGLSDLMFSIAEDLESIGTLQETPVEDADEGYLTLHDLRLMAAERHCRPLA